MLDILQRALELVETLDAAAPFPVEMNPDVIKSLRLSDPAMNVEAGQIVTKVSYAGDEGGIMCHLASRTGGNVLVVSLTHLQAPHNQSFTKAVLEYQKHRNKKLKKKFGRQ